MKFRRSSNKNMRRISFGRIRLLGVFFGLGVVSILLRSFYVQVVNRDPWLARANEQYSTRVSLPAERGRIFDRRLTVLAMDRAVFHLALDPSQIHDPAQVADSLAPVIGKSRSDILNLMADNQKQFVLVKEEINDEEREALSKLKLYGVILQKEQRRVRTFASMARQVIGVIDKENRAVGGVEEARDKWLRGEDGWALYQKDGYNQSFPSLDFPSEPPVDGKHVVLTLDQTLQTILEEELREGIKKYRAKNGCAVLMHPYTGELMGMASVWADPDSNKTPSYRELVQNRTAQWDFEPGSTFKIVTVAAALEEGLFDSNSLIYCENGSYRIGRHTIHDHYEKYGWLSLSGAVEHSSNIAMVKVAKKIGKQTLCRYARNFGFGTTTGIDVPMEVKGILHPPYKWNDFTTSTIAFGQGLSASALQVACMTAVIANGGELVKPYLIHSVLDPDGSVYEETRPQVIRRVIKEETAATLRVMMENVIKQGSGKLAAVEGLPIAGKTGTSEKVVEGIRGYAPGIHVSSFAGFWPVVHPRFVLVVVLDEPLEQYWASKSAAPIFKKIAERIYGLPGDIKSPEETGPDGHPENLFTLTSHQDQADPEFETESSESAPLNESIVMKYFVPGVKGKSLREALRLLGESGIEAEVEGRGRVVSQSLKAGSPIRPGMNCTLTCEQEG